TRHAKRHAAGYPENEIRQVIDVMSNPTDFSALEIGDESEGSELRFMRDRALIILLADTGLRVDEVCKLRRGDMDWAANRAILKGRGGKKDIIRFSMRAINASRDYLALREPLDLGSGQ